VEVLRPGGHRAAHVQLATRIGFVDHVRPLQRVGATVEALTIRRTAFVIATHDQAVVRMADRTLYLRHGAMEAEATRLEADASERERLAVIDDTPDGCSSRRRR
jgi:hypothetical protein